MIKLFKRIPFNFPSLGIVGFATSSHLLAEYKNSKDNTTYMFFSMQNFYDYEAFLKKFINYKLGYNIYTVYCKVRYSDDSSDSDYNFFMCGNQFGFKHESLDDILDLYNSISTRLELYFTRYNLTEESITYLQIGFIRLDLKVYNEFKLDKINDLSKTDLNLTKRLLRLPETTQQEQLGELLLKYIDENGYVYKIDITINGILYNFIDIIREKAKFLNRNHSDRLSIFDDSCKFYYVKSNIDYVLVIKILNNFVIKYKYSLYGVLITKVTDEINDTNGNVMTRNSGNYHVSLQNNEAIKTSQNIEFKCIPRYKIKNSSFLPNSNIGVIDTETYQSDDNIQKIYCLGFKTNLNENPVTYYIDKTSYDSNKIVYDMINELLKSKYSNITFYCHNLSGYDIVFMLKPLLEYNDTKYYSVDDKYKISCILRDNKIIKVTIKKGSNSVSILDSYCMLKSSLAKLGKDFDVDVVKSTFPYKFSLQDNLFYIGNTPAIQYYNNISKINYNNLYSETWSFKDESIKYLENDLNSLHSVITKANTQIFNDYGINIMESITISGLAMKIYLSKYYKDNIPRLYKASIYNDIKNAYYGGITEVYKPEGINLYYYDVNSLYPYVALNSMPGLSCTKVNYIKYNENIDNLFGFFYCEIESPNDLYIGLLPIRTASGIEFPTGKWSSWYFSEELKFAKENGYNIKVIKGYIFDKIENVFKDYITDIYKIKSSSINNTQKAISKSLLNNLLGRFGITFDKAITELLTTEQLQKKSLMYKITSYLEISKNKYLVSYVPKLDSDIIKSHGLDIIKLVSKYKDVETRNIDNTSVVISAAVTAYARIYISKIKLYILSKGGNIYYSDTDSIVTDIDLSNNMVNNKEIGKLKLEHKVKKGIFIAGKTYCLIDKNDTFINKAKGIKAESLSYNDYEKLLKNENVTTAVKNMSKINWNLGEVKIIDKENIVIRSDSYIKRVKIYDKFNKWVDTRPNYVNLTNNRSYYTYNSPIFINYFDKSLVVYKQLYIIPYEKQILDIIVYDLPKTYNKINTNNTNKYSSPLNNNKSVTSHDFKSIFINFALVALISVLYMIYVVSKDDEFNETSHTSDYNEILPAVNSNEMSPTIGNIGLKSDDNHDKTEKIKTQGIDCDQNHENNTTSDENYTSDHYDNTSNHENNISNNKNNTGNNQDMGDPTASPSASAGENKTFDSTDKLNHCNEIQRLILTDNIKYNEKYSCVQELECDIDACLATTDINEQDKTDIKNEILRNELFLRYVIMSNEQSEKHFEELEQLYEKYQGHSVKDLNGLEEKLKEKWNNSKYNNSLMRSMKDRLDEIELYLEEKTDMTNVETMNSLLKDKAHLNEELKHAEHINEVIEKQEKYVNKTLNSEKSISDKIKILDKLHDKNLSYNIVSEDSPEYSNRLDVIKNINNLDSNLFDDASINELEDWLKQTNEQLSNTHDENGRRVLLNTKDYITNQLENAAKVEESKQQYLDKKENQILEVDDRKYNSRKVHKSKTNKKDWIDTVDNLDLDKLFSENKNENNNNNKDNNNNENK